MKLTTVHIHDPPKRGGGKQGKRLAQTDHQTSTAIFTSPRSNSVLTVMSRDYSRDPKSIDATSKLNLSLFLGIIIIIMIINNVCNAWQCPNDRL